MSPASYRRVRDRRAEALDSGGDEAVKPMPPLLMPSLKVSSPLKKLKTNKVSSEMEEEQATASATASATLFTGDNDARSPPGDNDEYRVIKPKRGRETYTASVDPFDIGPLDGELRV